MVRRGFTEGFWAAQFLEPLRRLHNCTGIRLNFVGRIGNICKLINRKRLPPLEHERKALVGGPNDGLKCYPSNRTVVGVRLASATFALDMGHLGRSNKERRFYNNELVRE